MKKSDDMPTLVSLAQIVRLALPMGSKIRPANAESRNRQVHWAVVVGVPLRRDAMVEQGDLVFCAVRSDEPNWVDALEQLTVSGAAAVVMNVTPPPALLKKADSAHMPIVVMPEGANLREAHRATLTLIANQDAHIAQLTAKAYHSLVKLSAESRGLDAIAKAMAELTGHSVIVHDKRLAPLVVIEPESAPEKWKKLLSEVNELDSLPSGWADRKQVAARSITEEHQQLSSGYARLVMPIVVGRLARGYVSIISDDDEGLDALDALVIEQGAAACGLEMSRAKAVSEATKRLRGDFLDAVLAGAIPQQEIKRWAERIGHDITAPHAAIIFSWPDVATPPSMRRLETMVNGEIGTGRASALTRISEGEVAVFVNLGSDGSLKGARALAQSVCDQAAKEFPKVKLLCGLGRPATTVADWRVSYKEGGQAVAAARRMGEGGPLFFGDLSVYRLLFQLEGHSELTAFCNETLGALIDYDHAHNSSLIQTLAAYFAHHGNLSQTAEALYIHRNTLQYRMDRIAEISGFDLDNPETRLAVQLAIKAYRLLHPKAP
jgi:PucR family transcriptional regulator, purine catabolism regulatory protein